MSSPDSQLPVLATPAATPEISSAPPLKPTHKQTSAKSHLAAGFISGLTSSVLLQPLDLLKTRIQQQSTITSSTSSALSSSATVNTKKSLRQTIKEIDSVFALWRGTSVSAIRTSVGSALYLTTLNITRTYLSKTSVSSSKSSTTSSTLPKLTMYGNLASGAIVRGAVGFITMPITVVKVRYESSLFHYTSMSHAVKDIFSTHGIPGFFKGYGVTFLRDAPNAGLYVLFYEMWKDALSKSATILGVSPEERALLPTRLEAVAKEKPQSTALFGTSTSAVINSGSAVLASGMATGLTGPFDTIKTRVQLDPVRYPTVWSAISRIVGEEGFRGLFDGLSLRLTRKAMSAGIAWCIYEELVKVL